MLDRNRGALPLYKQLEAIIKESIDNGKYSYGEILPAESEYMNKYGVSRITVRQALLDLASNSYVQGRPGIGTIVTYRKIEETLKGIKSFSEEMLEHGIEMKTISCETAYVHPTLQIANMFNIAENENCLRIERIRTANDAPIVFSTTFIHSCVNLSDDSECYSKSLYKYLNTEYGIIITKATDILEATIADSTIAEALCIKEGDAVFKRTRKGFDQKGEPLEISISFYPGERYRYSINL